jgi:hypothetical protein
MAWEKQHCLLLIGFTGSTQLLLIQKREKWEQTKAEHK